MRGMQNSLRQKSCLQEMVRFIHASISDECCFHTKNQQAQAQEIRRELAGRHAGLAAGDAKWMSEMQNNIVACMRSANMPNGRPTCRRGSPRCKKKPRTTTYYHIRPRTTTYYHVLSRTTTSVVFASRAATHACRPASSRSLLLNCYLLTYCRTSTY